MDVQGKVAIITGASKGIGLATAWRLAEAGAKVMLAARSVDKLNQAAAELRQKGYEAAVGQVDMRNPVEIARMIETAIQTFGRIDILINNAGQGLGGRVADLDIDQFRQTIDLNLIGPVLAMQAVIPIMRDQGGGLIVNVSSMVSKMNIPGIPGYAATKAALNMISQTAREELAPDHIRVVTVFPRITSTNFGQNALRNPASQGHLRPPHSNVTVDPPEHVAEKILAAIRDEPVEQYME